ncbi:MAG: SIS domain-containing protein [Deltaproteobacteria bacterium]|nr:SIS domain-containing protein [Deltaproteobacteria bacterium]
MNYSQSYLLEAKSIIDELNPEGIEKIAKGLHSLREGGGRLFVLGVGGGAGHANHAVNDFRKIVGLESYAPTDNVSELTARINDDGWETSFANWLKVSRISARDGILVFSVGGGNEKARISVNIVNALKLSKESGAKIFGIVGRDGGFTAQVADAVVIIPTVNKQNITPHTEAFQAVIWHLLVSHPLLALHATKWESVQI